MSNVIKAYTVRYDELAKITLDTHFRIDKELEERKKQAEKAEVPGNDEFVEGIQAVVVETVPDPEETRMKAEQLLTEAKAEAEEIIANAKKEAERMKSVAFEEAQKKGYEEGILRTKEEEQRLKNEYERLKSELHKEYEALEASLEPQMAQIIGALVEKMTGILVSDREDVILYLIEKSLKNMDKSSSYTIKVSQDDYEYVNARKDILLDAVKEIPLYITVDSGLTKNQCLIETDLRVINCSLDIQLNNLITDLKLISSVNY